MLPGYWQQTFGLGPDPDGEGDLVATLVRRGEPDPSATHAVLLVHGFTDYFFNTELADHFAARGFAFYALDMNKCGRSWREGQTPHFTTDLARYDTELERALDLIAREPPRRADVLIYGHSTGGLIVPLWLDRMRRRGDIARRHITGLVLNSPWLDLQGPAILRAAPTGAAIGAISRIRKKRVVRPPTEGGIRRHPAQGVRRRVRLRPEVEADRRLSRHVRLAARHPPRAGQAAPRAGRRCAQPDPAVGSQRAGGHRPRKD